MRATHYHSKFINPYIFQVRFQNVFSSNRKRERENRFKALKLIAIMMITAMMAIPIIQHFNNDYATVPVESYSYGNEMIKFVGSNAFIGFQGNLFPVSWNVFELNPNFSPGSQITPFTTNNTNTSAPLIEENFSHYSTKRIQSLWQDSAIIVKWDHYVRIAEIFSFTTKGIDASIVIKNLNATGNYISAFSLNTGINNTISVNGFNPSCQNISSGMGIIPSGDWNVTVGSLSMNWQSEDSIFHSGIVSQGTSSDSIILPFDAGTLYHNESYTIDPMIYYQPFMIIRGPIGGPTPPPPPPPSSPTYYDITFTATGLPSGTSWYATLNGQTQSTTSSSITFRDTSGTYSYSIGSVSGYTVSPSSGSVSVGGSQSVSVTYTELPPSCPVIGYIGATFSVPGTSHLNLTSAIDKTINGHTNVNCILPAEGSTICLSIPYQNADIGNGQVTSYASASNPTVSPDSIIRTPPGNVGTPFRGILVYTLTSKGGFDYPIYCNQDVSGNGVVKFSWRTQPGVYGGFLIELVNNYGIKNSSYNYPFDVYSTFMQGSRSYQTYASDSSSVNAVYTSGGVFIGDLGIAASNGADGTACTTDSQIKLGLSTEFISPYDNATSGSYTYGILNYNQYLNYTGSQYGVCTNDNSCYTPLHSFNEAQSKGSASTSPNLTLAIESLYGVIDAAAFLSVNPYGWTLGFLMTALAPFLFHENTPSTSDKDYWGQSIYEENFSYGNWHQSGNNIPPQSSICVGTVIGPMGAAVNICDPVYTIVNNGNGNPSWIQLLELYLEEPNIPNVQPGSSGQVSQNGLNYFTYSVSETIVPIAHTYSHGSCYHIEQNDYVNATYANGQYTYSGSSYAAAASLQIYLPLTG